MLQNKEGLEAGAPVANGAGSISDSTSVSSQAMRKEPGSNRKSSRTRSPSRSPAIVITEGQEVEVLNPATGAYHRGMVLTILPTGDLDVQMPDGSTQSCVDLNLVRPLALHTPARPRSSASKETPTPSKQGATDAPPSASAVSPETAAEDSKDSKGSAEKVHNAVPTPAVAAAAAIAVAPAVAAAPSADEGGGKQKQPSPSHDLAVGMKVLCELQGGQGLPGHVSRVHGDGCVDVECDDGSVARRVPRSKVKPMEKAPIVGESGPITDMELERGLGLGAKVEVQSSEKGGQWDRATITALHADGRLEVAHEGEGGAEGSRVVVAVSRVRPAGPQWGVEEGSGVEIDLDVGTALRLVLTGHVAQLDRFNGRCDVVFANGLRKEKVPLSSLKRPTSTSTSTSSVTSGEHFSAGQAVERRLGQHWLRGRILQKHTATSGEEAPADDGGHKYDVEYCGVEAGVASSELRVHDGPPLNVNDGVLVRFHNGHATRYVPATVQRVDRHSGMVDVRYADSGVVETNLHASILQEPMPSLGVGKPVPPSPWSVGERVEARFRGGVRWFPGTVSLLNSDGSVDVVYDDGDEETCIDPNHVRPLTRAAAGGPVVVGGRVEARFRGGPVWYAGKVTAVHEDGCVDVEYDDGDTEERVAADNVRPFAEAAGASEGQVGPGEYKVGDRIVALYQGGINWFPGKVTAVHEDGCVDVEYDDGDTEARVIADNVRPIAQAAPAAEAVAYKVGDRVVALFQGGSNWFAGKVTAVHEDGCVDVEYDDGDTEARVVADNVRPFTDAASAVVVEAVAYKVGDRIVALFQGGDKWFAGKVTAVHEDGCVDVEYDDGDKEARLGAGSVRPFLDAGSGASGSPRLEAYKVGDRVVALFQGGDKWFAGKVTAVHPDGCVDVEYDDGDKEARVAAGNVRPFTDAGSGAPGSPRLEGYKVGDRIVALYQGGDKWFAGKVTAVHADGCVDVEYDDGDKEARVVADNVRPFTDAAGPAEAVAYTVGDRIVALFQGGDKWYAGKVTAVHTDGCVDVEYDDGDTEARVVADNVRPFTDATGPAEAAAEPVAVAPPASAEAAPKASAAPADKGEEKGDKADSKTEAPAPAPSVVASPEAAVKESKDVPADRGEEKERGDKAESKDTGAAEAYKVGDRVVALFQGGHRWYAGKVTIVHTDGCVDVEYDDGDTEARVVADNVRPFTDAASTVVVEAVDYEVGDRVVARFQGGETWFAGKVTAVHEDGCVDVEYDDGDSEARVGAEHVRPFGGLASAPAGEAPESPKPVDYTVGDRVVARFQGAEMWFAGKVTAVHADGCVDVEYDDGDSEARVAADNVRPFGGAAIVPAAEAPESPKPVEYKAGDRVVARFQGGETWFAGKVTAVHEDGCVDVEYDGGDSEARVVADNVRPFADAARASVSAGVDGVGVGDGPVGDGGFAVGDRVEARFGGGERWFPGTVTLAKEGGACDVLYDDGDREADVPPDNIRRPVVVLGEEPVPGEGYKVGDRVVARFRRLSKWYPGVATAVHADGSVDVAYDDGDSEMAVGPDVLRLVALPPAATEAAAPAPSAVPAAARAAGAGGRFAEGDAVEARFKGRAKFLRGRVSAVNDDGSYDVEFESGDEECAIPPDHVRPLPAVAPIEAYVVGDRVEARFRGKSRWFAGKVGGVHADGSVDVHYDDGDKENFVSPTLVRRLPPPDNAVTPQEKATAASASSSSAGGVATADPTHRASLEPPPEPSPLSSELGMGDRVEGRCHSNDGWLRGSLISRDGSGTFDVRFENREWMHRVPPSDLRRPLSALVGQRVEALRPSSGSYETATVLSVSVSDKAPLLPTYRLRFGEGAASEEADVADVDVRVIFDHPTGQGQGQPSPAAAGEAVTAAVTAAAPATVEKEKAPAIAKQEQEATHEHEHGVGDKVETRYRGGRKWFGALITKVHGDKSVDVTYHDGEVEEHVLHAHIRLPGDAPTHDEEEGGAAEHSHAFAVNQRVEARPRTQAGPRSNSWVAARIVGLHPHAGSYDVRYEATGEVEGEVHAEWLRPLPGTFHDHHGRSGSLQRVALEACEGAYRPGDRVEGFSGSDESWAPAIVTATHHHGTLDLMYEDGRVEANVSPDHVRRGPSPRATAENPEQTPFGVGAKVEACVDGGSRWFPAVVKAHNRDGTFHVRLNDGTREARLPASKLRIRRSSAFVAVEAQLTLRRREEDARNPPKPPKPTTAEATTAPASAPSPERWASQASPQRRLSQPPGRRASLNSSQKRASNGRVGPTAPANGNGPVAYKNGDRVQGRQKGGKLWVDGRIVGVNSDSGDAGYVTYEVRYEGGGRENYVDAVLLRLPPTSSEEEAPVGKSEQFWEEGMFRVGEAVEARLQGGSEWLPGTIHRIAPDRLYEIVYRTGHKESGVEGFLVRYPLAVGTRVEAHFRGGKKWFPATITAVHEEVGGTLFDVLYDDGDTDSRVRACDVRRPGDESAAVQGKGESFKGGDKVEVRYQGLSDWLPGVVACANGDGTYSVEFENFMAEAAVRPEHIRRPLPPSERETTEGEGSMTVAEYYMEQTAAATLGASSTSHGRRGSRQMNMSGTAIQERLVLGPGHRVEARFRGGKKWFGGRILQVNRDGSCDVRYVDGDVERCVDPGLIRFPIADDGPIASYKPAVPLPRGLCTYTLGEKILARFPFELDYIPGKVIAVHRDGTYDVRFEDGSKDSHVHPKYIKRRKSTPKLPAPHRRNEGRFHVAQLVEARAPGSVDWRPALVTAVLEEGQYAIKYQDHGPSSGSALVVAHNLLRDMSAGEGLRAQVFEVGQTVEALYALGDAYFLAKVVGSRDERTAYDLRYSDGDLETGVGAEFMRPLLEVGNEPEFDINDHLAVKVGDEWVPAKVRRVNQTHDGKFCYDVVTLSGTKRLSRIPAEALRKLFVEAEAPTAGGKTEPT